MLLVRNIVPFTRYWFENDGKQFTGLCRNHVLLVPLRKGKFILRLRKREFHSMEIQGEVQFRKFAEIVVNQRKDLQV